MHLILEFITLYTIEGCVRRHILVNSHAQDYIYLEVIALEKGKMGMYVDILPTLAATDPLRNILFPDAIGSKCPDLRINGELWEVKQPTNPRSLNNIKHTITAGAHQSNRVIINLVEKFDDQYLFRIAKGRFKDHKNLEVIEFRYEGVYISFRRAKKRRSL